MKKEIYLAGGCFWGTEKYLSNIKGILATEVGYANGTTQNPTYEDVCHRNTGHAETVKVIYDTQQISLSQILELFYDVIDPTSINRQGPDVGTQYRTGIYYIDSADEAVIRHSIEILQKKLDKPIAIEVKPLAGYYKAEEYHQHYLDKNPNGYCHIPAQKFEKVRNRKPYQSTYQPKSKEELKKTLSPIQYDVTQNNATEPPFRNEYYDNHEPGIYVDITTGEPLFVSSDQFNSGCGWPSFSRPIDNDLLLELTDSSLKRLRTEVRSKTGNAHLGHVFDDGPKEMGGLRYCINSAALKFIPREEMEKSGYGDLIDLIR